MPREYRPRRRAETQRATRRRIVEATIELHRTVGPAQTTISAIADLAGVERRTFYRHFPDPAQVLLECSALYRALNPPPDPRSWLETADPLRRLQLGLLACYRYYRANAPMIGNVLRDRAAGLPVGDGFIDHREAARRALAEGLSDLDRPSPRVEAALALVLDFHAWEILAENGLTDDDAAAMGGSLVEHALESSGAPKRAAQMARGRVPG